MADSADGKSQLGEYIAKLKEDLKKVKAIEKSRTPPDSGFLRTQHLTIARKRLQLWPISQEMSHLPITPEGTRTYAPLHVQALPLRLDCGGPAGELCLSRRDSKYSWDGESLKYLKPSETRALCVARDTQLQNL
jgi:hypothetical protein